MKSDKVEKRAASIFLQAASYIRLHGWQKEGMGEEGAPRCSMGALESAGPPRDKWDKDLSVVMYESLYSELNGLSLTQFNARFQSGEKVAELYERVARKLSKDRTFRGNLT